MLFVTPIPAPSPPPSFSLPYTTPSPLVSSISPYLLPLSVPYTPPLLFSALFPLVYSFSLCPIPLPLFTSSPLVQPLLPLYSLSLSKVPPLPSSIPAPPKLIFPLSAPCLLSISSSLLTVSLSVPYFMSLLLPPLIFTYFPSPSSPYSTSSSRLSSIPPHLLSFPFSPYYIFFPPPLPNIQK